MNQAEDPKLLNISTFLLSHNNTDSIFFYSGPEGGQHNSLVILVVELVVAGIGAILNFMVLLTIICSKHVQDSNTTKFIASLSVSDFLICSFVMTINAFQQFGKLKHISDSLTSSICYGMNSSNVFALTSSSYTVLTIAIDRYVCVGNPSYYYCHITNTKIAAILFLVWTISIILAVVPLFTGSVSFFKSDLCVMKITPLYQTGMVTIVIFIPCSIICLIYSTIFLSAYEHIRTMANRRSDNAISATTTTTFYKEDEDQPSLITKSTTKSTPSSAKFNLDFTAHVNFIEEAAIEDGNFLKRRVRHSLKTNFLQHIGSSRTYATVTMWLVVGVFLIHWLPFGIVNVVDAFLPTLVPNYAVGGFMWFLLMNSCWNPIIYALSNSVVRNDMLRVMSCRCSRMSRSSINYCPNPQSKTSIMFSGLGLGTSCNSMNLFELKDGDITLETEV